MTMTLPTLALILGSRPSGNSVAVSLSEVRMGGRREGEEEEVVELVVDVEGDEAGAGVGGKGLANPSTEVDMAGTLRCCRSTTLSESNF